MPRVSQVKPTEVNLGSSCHRAVLALLVRVVHLKFGYQDTIGVIKYSTEYAALEVDENV